MAEALPVIGSTALADVPLFDIGLANTLPIMTAVPEPATVVSMLAGIGLMSQLMSRRRVGAGDAA